MSRSVVLYLVLLAVIIVFWVGGHQSILLNAFNCWETKLGRKLKKSQSS